MVAISRSGQFNGYQTFMMMPGKYYIPPHLRPVASGTTFSTTAARYYVVPWIIEQATTLAGAWCYNGGAGDNGDKFKMALYAEKSTGGPGALVKSFGEGTFTAAAIVNGLASSATIAPGKYYLEFVTDNAVTMYCMAPMDVSSTVGYVLPAYAANTMGSLAAPLLGTGLQDLQPAGDYVGGTYANFPESTSLTPTATLAGVNRIPYFGLST